jgi:hypothetical protein
MLTGGRHGVPPGDDSVPFSIPPAAGLVICADPGHPESASHLQRDGADQVRVERRDEQQSFPPINVDIRGRDESFLEDGDLAVLGCAVDLALRVGGEIEVAVGVEVGAIELLELPFEPGSDVALLGHF